jgi:hypothetical protein
MSDQPSVARATLGAGGTLLTFDEQDLGLRGAFASDVADRLAGVTAAYDPGGLFVANQVVKLRAI